MSVGHSGGSAKPCQSREKRKDSAKLSLCKFCCKNPLRYNRERTFQSLGTNEPPTHTHTHIPRVERTAVGTTRLPIAPRRCHAKHPLLAYAERLRACSAAMPQNRKQFKRQKFLKPLEFAFFVRCDASFLKSCLGHVSSGYLNSSRESDRRYRWVAHRFVGQCLIVDLRT